MTVPISQKVTDPGRDSFDGRRNPAQAASHHWRGTPSSASNWPQPNRACLGGLRPGMTPPSLFDRAIVDDLSETIGAAGTRRVLALFIRESRAYAATIAEAVKPGSDGASHDRARRVAHSLKSSAGQVGAMALAALAAAVELAAGDGAPDLAQKAAALQNCAEDTVAALNEFLSE